MAYEMRISDWSSDVCSSDLWVYEHPLLILAAAMLLPLPALFPWDKWLRLEAKTTRAATVLLALIAAFASWHMVYQWTARLDGAAAGWCIALFVIVIIVIGRRWSNVPVLPLFLIGLLGWVPPQVKHNCKTRGL